MRWLSLTAILAACGGTAVTQTAPPPQPAASEKPRPRLTPDQEPSPVRVEVARLPIPSATTQEVEPPSCEGTDLNLASLAARGQCQLDRTAAELPQGLAASLQDDEVTVVQGKEASLRVLLRNTTKAALPIEVDASCWFLNVIDAAVYDSHGTRVDRVSNYCDVDAKPDCAGNVVGVRIAPGGHAYVQLSVLARVSVLGERCVEYAGRALSPGSYTIELRTHFATEPLRARMNVLPLVRIDRSDCPSYSEAVAKVAEPDDARRPEVAARLGAQCERQPPAKELADCQLAAKTAEQLKACE